MEKIFLNISKMMSNIADILTIDFSNNDATNSLDSPYNTND